MHRARHRSTPGRRRRGTTSRARRSTSSPRDFGFEGLRSCVVAACSSSTIAIGQAADAIRAGRLDAALAGGTDALARLTFSGFNALRLMDPEPCRPFDRGRAGMNIGEGAAILVLEEMDRARARGAHDLRRAGRLQLRAARRSIRPPRSRTAGRSPPSSAQALRDAGVAAGRRRSRQRARHRHAAERSRRGARATAACSASAARAHAGHLDQVDGRPLPRRRRRHRGRGAGADASRAASFRRPSITARPIRSARSTSSPTTRARCASRCGVSTSLGFGGNDSALVITRGLTPDPGHRPAAAFRLKAGQPREPGICRTCHAGVCRPRGRSPQ